MYAGTNKTIFGPLFHLRQGLSHLLSLGKLIVDRRSDIPLFDQILFYCDRNLDTLLHLIQRVINLDEDDPIIGSGTESVARVRRGIDEEVRTNGTNTSTSLKSSFIDMIG